MMQMHPRRLRKLSAACSQNGISQAAQGSGKYSCLSFIMAIVFVLLLGTGCQSHQSKSGQPDVGEMPTDEAEQQLWLAEQGQPSDRVKHLLKALAIFYDREDYSASQQIINQLSTESLNSQQYQKFAVLAGQVAIDQNNAGSALRLLDNAPPNTFEFAPPEVRITVTELRSKALFQMGDYFNSAKTRAIYSGLFTGMGYRDNIDKIWTALRKVATADINQALETENDYVWRGWLELISSINQNQSSLERQHNALEQWQVIWTDHDASAQLPAELQMLSKLPELRPRKVALALPLSGQFSRIGKAIRDGFLAAYYHDSLNRSVTTEVTIFDSTSLATVIDLYLEIQLQNYDLFIGPLKKESVSEFSSLPLFEPPVLALNYLEEQVQAIEGFYQFGLSTEDEIKQILNLLEAQGKNRLAIIQQDQLWARKLILPIKTWAGQRGFPEPLVYQFNAEEDLSDGLAGMLQITASGQRARQIRNLVGNVEFEPRRREDIDALILLALPDKARQIKPLLSFHYASNIPLYAPSRIFSGISRPTKNHDLNGILYTEIPWLLNNIAPVRKSIQYLSGPNAYERLYAMGADAYTLAPRLPLLRHFPESVVQGHTGDLTVNDNLQIRRQLEWATFDKGEIKPQPNTETTPPKPAGRVENVQKIP